MPTSPADAEDLARAVAVIYEDAEQALLQILARALAEGIESPRWAEAKLAAIGDVRKAIEDVTTALHTDASGAIGRAVREAYQRGGQSAVAELGALDEGRRAFAARHLPNASAAERLANAAVDEQGPVFRRILREPLDAYRSIVARVSANTVLGTLTRRATAQRALSQFAQRGITSFTDTAGRRWTMSAYAEMAVRSATARAAIEGHLDQLTALGEQLVIASVAVLDCPLCEPWQGEILSINGQSGPHSLRLPKAIQPTGIRAAFRAPETVVVHVAGSLTEARAKGFLHPNCRHNISVYLPGVTTRPPHHATPGTTYKDTQRQREIERNIREWKRRQAAAMDEQARKRAAAYVRKWQQAARENVAAHPEIRRKPHREQIGRAT